MHRSFDYLIKPLLEEFNFKHIVEVGAKDGFNTEKLLGICNQKKMKLSVIDPFPNFNVFKFQREIGPFDMYEGISLEELPRIQDYDVILLDGDHNYYTLKSELELIYSNCEEFPVVFFHDVAWPYARRDMYYNPESIPEEFRNEYERSGIQLEKDDLVEGGFNGHLLNAKKEYTEKNGVLTAIEDFINECSMELTFKKIKFKNGIGILTNKDKYEIIERFEQLSNSKSLVEILELDNNKYQSDLVLLKNTSDLKIKNLNQIKNNYEEKNKELVNNLNSYEENFMKLEKEKENLKILNQKLEDELVVLNISNDREKNKISSLHNEVRTKNDILKKKNILINDLNNDILSNKNDLFFARIYEHTRFTNGLSKSEDIQKFKNSISLMLFYTRLLINGNKKNHLNLIKDIKLLKCSDFFDLQYYLLNNPDVYYSRINPYIHYIYFGGFEGRNPSNKFNSKFYLEEYGDVRNEKVNPLIHYLKYGSKEDRVPCLNEIGNSKRNPVEQKKLTLDFREYNFNLSYNPNYIIDIIIPVHNAHDDVLHCLHSLLMTKTLNYNLIIVNDGSKRETTELLEVFVRKFNCKYIHNENAKGYTFAINSGLRISDSNYKILLNSDTIVTIGWLENMLDVFHKYPRTGIVGPLSNAASFQTVPEIMSNGDWKVCTLPEGISLELYATIIKKVSRKIYPKVTFVNGFCFMISKEVISKIGLFDEEIFGSGYGEENDFCLRALENKFELRIADDTYIFHEKSKSFTHETRKVLSSEASKKLNQKHGIEIVSNNVNKMKENKYLHEIRSNIILNTEKFQKNNYLLSKTIFYYLPTKSASGGVNSVLQEVEELRKLGYNANIINRTANYSEYLDIFPQAKEFTYFVKNTVEFISLMREVDVLVSTVNSGTPLTNLMRAIYPNKTYLYYVQDYEPLFYNKKQNSYDIAFKSYSLFNEKEMFAKTSWIKEQLKVNHDKDIYKVNPSIDTKIYNAYETVVKSTDKMTIATMLRFSTQRRNPLKTIKILNEIASQIDIEVLIFGCTTEELESQHIEFKYENFGVIAKEEVPEIFKKSTIFLDYSEFQAFGRTGLEAMALGVVPILPKAGGISEYAIDGVNCLVLDTKESIQKNSKKIIEFINNKELIEKVSIEGRNTAKSYNVKNAVYSISECINWNIGDKAENSFCTILTDGTIEGTFNGTGYIRTILPIVKYALSINRKVTVMSTKSHNLDEIFEQTQKSEKVVIQREFNLGLDHAGELISKLKEKNIEVIYEIDDNLLYYKHHKGDLVKFYLNHADKVVVSTEMMANLVEQYNPNTIIIENKPYHEFYEKENEKISSKNKTKYIGYFGTPSHKNDLEMIKEQILKLKRLLKTKYNTELIFQVIGVTEDEADWYDLIQINSECTKYPIFSLEMSRIAKNWDIGLILGEENEFTKCKSDLKYFEHTAMNILSCASNIHPYNKVIQNGINGYLVEKNEWCEKLLNILVNNKDNNILKNAISTCSNREDMHLEWGKLLK